ncbi:hypothetical protein PIECOFPK_02644 [Mycovorax composti]|jgi:hypothetical protein|uniref:Uncharacterized protein n=1 Tax=Mycovorax composti TaxID=2962693 RepID=A0ABZ2ENS5_9BACT
MLENKAANFFGFSLDDLAFLPIPIIKFYAI